MSYKHCIHFHGKKTMEKQLKFEIRHDHSLDDQKKLPPAAARCASENRNYTWEYDQCSPALRFQQLALRVTTDSIAITCITQK